MHKNILIKFSRCALVLAVTGINVAHAQFGPVRLDPASYNQDMIVERPLPATTASLDNGPANTGASFYEQGYYVNDTTTGLPPAGTTIVSAAAADHSFTFAPDYTLNNAVLIDPTITNATITVTVPAAYSALSFLVAAGNGAETIVCKVHHQDNSIDTGTFVIPDWFNNTPVAYTANGRCDVQARTFDNIGAGNPRLYTKDLTLGNASSPVTSIDFTRSGSGGHGAIFAVSGSSGAQFDPIAFTGYNKDMIVEAGAQELPPAGLYTTASMDTGTANTANGWYVKGFNTAQLTTGLPAAGATIASAAALDHQFTFATNYAANNVVYVDAATAGTMIWAVPAKHSALSFLASAGHGPVVVDYTVNHADASVESGTFAVSDWFNGTPVAYNANGRIDVVSGLFNNVSAGNPRLYTVDVTLNNTVSPVTSVNLTFDGANTNANGVVAFFAVSGTGGSIAPVVVTQPVSFNTNAAAPAQIAAAVSGSAPLTYRWQKSSGGAFTNLANVGRISGATSTNLIIANATFSDDGYYQLIATNVAGSVTSSAAYLNVVSATPVVTTPGNAITMYNGSSPAAEVVQNAIDGTTSKYLNFGANTFPPFVGPVGFVVTPAMGSTVVTGLRMFTANDSPERDPADYLLEGSNNGGGTFAAIASGSISLPDDRNAAGQTIDAIAEFNREINFPNQTAYTTYRLSISTVKNSATANSMQVGEVQLLGTPPPVAVTITYHNLGNSQWQLQWPQGTLQSSANAAGPYVTVPGATSPYPFSTATGSQFYRIKVQ